MTETTKWQILNRISMEERYLDSLSQLERERLKTLFHLHEPQSLVDALFAEVYHHWLSRHQCQFIEQGRLQVRILPLGKSLLVETDKALSLHSILIEDLVVYTRSYGFSVEIGFYLPYSQKDSKAFYDLLLADAPFAIHIRFCQLQLKNESLEQDKKSAWQLEGYIDTSKDDHKRFTENSFRLSRHEQRRFLYCRLKFCDVLAFAAKRHHPIMVVNDKSYEEIFRLILKPFETLCRVKIDKSAEQLMLKRPWVAINCRAPRVSAYDYILRTLKFFKLGLYYDYSATPPGYTISAMVKNTQTKTQILPGISIDVLLRQQSAKMPGKWYFKNHQWQTEANSTQPYQFDENTMYPGYADSICLNQTTASFDYHCQQQQAEIERQAIKSSSLKLKLRFPPCGFSPLPMNGFRVEKTFISCLLEPDSDYIITEFDIHFSAIDSVVKTVGSQALAQVSSTKTQIDSAEFNLCHGITINLTIVPKDKLSQVYPDFNDDILPFKTLALISDGGTNQSRSYHMVDAMMTKVLDINSNIQSYPHTLVTEDDELSDQQLCYQLQLPAILKSEASQSTLFISLAYRPQTDHAVLPFRKGSVVELALYQETAEFIQLRWHSLLDKNLDKDRQHNKLTFGCDDSAGIVHQAEISRLNDGLFRLYANNAKNSAVILSNNEALDIIYQNIEKEGEK
ncbi:MAG: hypothetical protein ACO2ZM_03405 [Francisellaceae bacterium]